MTALSYSDLNNATSIGCTSCDRATVDVESRRWNQLKAATLIAALGLAPATGAVVPTFRAIPSSNSIVSYTFRSGTPGRRGVLTLRTSDKLAAIRRYLSMNMTELARVLRVERPTVYAWITERSEAHARNLDRVEQIYSVARRWRDLNAMPAGTAIRVPMSDGRSILQLLESEVIDRDAVMTALVDLQSHNNRGTSARETISEASRRMGLRDVPELEQQSNFDEGTSI